MTTLPPYVTEAAIVLDDVQLVYVPVPKAGSTAMLWALSEVAGLERDAFRRSAKLEVSRSLTIHDRSIWGPSHRLVGRDPRDVRRIFGSPDWLAFTIVREPVRRIWSAWVSKILVHDPRFVAPYGREEWFPDRPRSAHDIVTSFRHFLAVAPGTEAWMDIHWSSQAELVGIGRIDYDIVGRVEDLDSVLNVVGERLTGHGFGGLELRRANESLVTWAPQLLDDESRERCAQLTERDRNSFDYELPPRADHDPDERWLTETSTRLPAIHAVIERNERIGDLRELVMRTREP